MDGRFPFSYTYRDWVIQAFNDDMPYDQFLSWQIAADRLIKHSADHSFPPLTRGGSRGGPLPVTQPVISQRWGSLLWAVISQAARTK